jgi:DNA-binding NtrC family response regulator
MTAIAPAPLAVPPATWHESIATCKRALIERALRRAHGNRTRAAERLGLQRTYLLRLMREMGVSAPRRVRRRRRPTACTPAAWPTPATGAR